MACCPNIVSCTNFIKWPFWLINSFYNSHKKIQSYIYQNRGNTVPYTKIVQNEGISTADGYLMYNTCEQWAVISSNKYLKYGCSKQRNIFMFINWSRWSCRNKRPKMNVHDIHWYWTSFFSDNPEDQFCPPNGQKIFRFAFLVTAWDAKIQSNHNENVLIFLCLVWVIMELQVLKIFGRVWFFNFPLNPPPVTFHIWYIFQIQLPLVNRQTSTY